MFAESRETTEIYTSEWERPAGFPLLPVQSEQELQALEKFLSNDANLSAAVSFSLCVLVVSNDYVLKKLHIHFLFSFAEHVSWKICRQK